MKRVTRQSQEEEVQLDKKSKKQLVKNSLETCFYINEQLLNKWEQH
jgi:hypothetical protein